jgi:hypothetical protein
MPAAAAERGLKDLSRHPVPSLPYPRALCPWAHPGEKARRRSPRDQPYQVRELR